MKDQIESLWTHEEVADYIGATPGTIRVWCSQKRIPYLKIGRSVRFKHEDIDRWLNQKKVEAAQG